MKNLDINWWSTGKNAKNPKIIKTKENESKKCLHETVSCPVKKTDQIWCDFNDSILTSVMVKIVFGGISGILYMLALVYMGSSHVYMDLI